MQTIKEAKNKIVGLKQTLRAIQQDNISMVYLANDIEDHIYRKILTPCQEKNIPITNTNLSQRDLGRLCQIEVGAAVIGITKEK